jgi:hypothetical protein
MAHDTVKSSSPKLHHNRIKVEKRRCAAQTKYGTRCRSWAQRGKEFCYAHRHGDAEPAWQDDVPSQLPGRTKRQVSEGECAIQTNIQHRKHRQRHQKEKAKRDAEKAAWKSTHKIEVDVEKLTGNQIASQAVATTKLRTIEDCLALIEIAVDDLKDIGPSLGKSRVLIQAARTAGQLIIQAGVADTAVEWFQQNVKLVAGIDLDQI